MGKIFIVVLGIAFLIGGAFVMNDGRVVQTAMSADPVCTRSLGLDTPVNAGKTCAILSGTVARTFTSHSSKSSTDYIVVATSRGQLSVSIGERGTPVFSEAMPGTPAIVETVNGQPAFIATSDGTVSSASEPGRLFTVAWIFIGMGALLFVMAIFGRVKPRRRYARMRRSP